MKEVKEHYTVELHDICVYIYVQCMYVQYLQRSHMQELVIATCGVALHYGHQLTVSTYT